ncbi:dynamin-like protein [Hepatocystis sp. ex Piliocolobus tephrosceles]|nr:dynamin-like protein [Hepatocystis sp. ex Piliocolobus tephrosceles]
MDKLVPIVNKLQKVLSSLLSDESLSLPYIAVIGAQSVGKTSLLESLVGLSFMPKGEDIVTRTPIILQLTNCQDENSYCIVSYTDHKGCAIEKRVDDFSLLNNMLVEITDEITGGNKCIKDTPIIVEIHKNNVLDLTLIDLPGLTKVPVGDQPQNVEEQITNLVSEYICNENCIILAVSSANVDLANSDSLKMARKVDPKHERTIGVITKCDMVDKPDVWKKIVSGSVYPLKKGFVAVVCRSSKDIEQNVGIEESLIKEEEYFNNCIDPTNKIECLLECGINNLAKKLNNILIEHIKNTVPHLKPKIDALKNKEEEKLLELGKPMANMKQSDYLTVLVNYITQFSQQYQDIIDGKVFYKGKIDELKGGARIHYVFNDWYIKSLNEFTPLEMLTDEEIRIAIRNSSGPRGALFVPENAFETLIRKLINCLKEPSLRCADQVYDELLKIVDHCKIIDMERFTNLKTALNEQVKTLLKNCLQPTKAMINNLILIELSYINTSHPDFLNERFMKHVYEENNKVEYTDKNYNDGDNNYYGDHAYDDNSYDDNNNLDKDISDNNYINDKHDNKKKTYKNKYADEYYGYNNQYGNYNPNNEKSDTFNKKNVKNNKTKKKENPSIKDGAKLTLLSKDNIFTLPNIPEKIVPDYSTSSKEQIEIDLIKSLINNYFNIVRKHIADAVPKAIMYFMVNTSRKTMQKVLISNLHNAELVNLFNECPSIKEKRNSCQTNVDALNEAIKLLTEIRNNDF